MRFSRFASKPGRPALLALTALALASIAMLVWFARGVGGWLTTAILAGGAAAIAGLVQALASSGLRKSRRLVLGAAPPVAVSTEFYQQELALRGDEPAPGAVRCGYVLLTVEAAGSVAVVLKRLRVIVDSRGPGADTQPGHGHAPLAVRKFLVDLGEPNPRAVPQGVPDFPYVVSPGAPEVFQVMAHTDGEDVRWRLALDVTCKGEDSSVIIGQGKEGGPFRVSRRRADSDRQDEPADLG